MDEYDEWSIRVFEPRYPEKDYCICKLTPPLLPVIFFLVCASCYCCFYLGGLQSGSNMELQLIMCKE